MSNERSHSAVRNLRSIFENKSTESTPETRGRSPNGVGSDKENSRPRSKIRASFVAVEPSGSVMAEEAAGAMAELKPTTSADLRRDGFSEKDEEETPNTAAAEQVRQALVSNAKKTVPENVVESALSTPLLETKTLDDVNVSDAAPMDDKPSETPDKPTTGAEEEPLEMNPADITSQDAVSGGDALTPVVEDLKPATSTDTKTSDTKASIKPSAISTKAPSKVTSGSLKSPVSQPKTPTTKPSLPRKSEAGKPVTKLPSKKPSRSSLAAPTAASVARAAAAIEKSVAANSGAYSPPAKPKAKDVTKPLDISARLTAPTAASRARHEQASASSSSLEKPSIPTHLKTTSSARSTPRSSLSGGQRSASRVSLGASSRKPPPPPDGSFLERMTRPTAASQNRAQERAEVRSPQRPASKPAASLKAKTNGHTGAPRPSTGGLAEVEVDDATTLDETALLEQAGVETNGLAEETKEAIAPTFDPAMDAEAAATTLETENDTPLARVEAEGKDLEATPAFKAEETIR